MRPGDYHSTEKPLELRVTVFGRIVTDHRPNIRLLVHDIGFHIQTCASQARIGHGSL
jgi:hypothetical protein